MHPITEMRWPEGILDWLDLIVQGVYIGSLYPDKSRSVGSPNSAEPHAQQSST